MAKRRRSKYGAILAHMQLAGQFSMEMVERWLQEAGLDPSQSYNVIQLFRQKREALLLYRGVYSTRSVKNRKTLAELEAEMARNKGNPNPDPVAEPEPKPEPDPELEKNSAAADEISMVEAFRRELADLLRLPLAKIRVTIQIIG